MIAGSTLDGEKKIQEPDMMTDPRYGDKGYEENKDKHPN